MEIAIGELEPVEIIGQKLELIRLTITALTKSSHQIDNIQIILIDVVAHNDSSLFGSGLGKLLVQKVPLMTI